MGSATSQSGRQRIDLLQHVIGVPNTMRSNMGRPRRMPMARPKKQIDREIVQRLAERQASNRMIAAVVGCSARTLARRFGRHLPLWRECGKTRIIDKQWEAMEKGNIVMLIWLGKQHLGQKDKSEIDTTITLLPENPIEAYRQDAELLERALTLEKDLTNATTAPLNTRSADLPRLAVPPPPPSVGGNGNGTPHKPRPS